MAVHVHTRYRAEKDGRQGEANHDDADGRARLAERERLLQQHVVHHLLGGLRESLGDPQEKKVAIAQHLDDAGRRWRWNFRLWYFRSYAGWSGMLHDW